MKTKYVNPCCGMKLAHRGDCAGNTAKLSLAEVAGVTDGELSRVLSEYGYHELTIDRIVRAVNAHEELLDAVKSLRDIVDVSGKYPGAVRQVNKVIAKAEGR